MSLIKIIFFVGLLFNSTLKAQTFSGSIIGENEKGFIVYDKNNGKLYSVNENSFTELEILGKNIFTPHYIDSERIIYSSNVRGRKKWFISKKNQEVEELEFLRESDGFIISKNYKYLSYSNKSDSMLVRNSTNLNVLFKSEAYPINFSGNYLLFDTGRFSSGFLFLYNIKNQTIKEVEADVGLENTTRLLFNNGKHVVYQKLIKEESSSRYESYYYVEEISSGKSVLVKDVNNRKGDFIPYYSELTNKLVFYEPYKEFEFFEVEYLNLFTSSDSE